MAAPDQTFDGLNVRYLRLEHTGAKPPPTNKIYNEPLSAANLSTPSLAYPMSSPLVVTNGLCLPAKAETFGYHGAGACIYCGETVYAPNETRDLGEEHIISEALGSAVVLPGASCKEHERHTSRIESKLLQKLFDPTRKQLKIGRPILKGKFDVSRTVDGQNVTTKLPITDHPTVLFLPHMGAPGILTGRPKFLPGISGLWMVNINASEDNLKRHGFKSFATPPVDTILLTQYLCKIAFSFAAAEILVGNFEPVLLDFLLSDFGKLINDDRRYYLVGGDGKIDHPPTPYLHELGLALHERDGTKYLVARVRLLAFLGAPVYYVVVGTVPADKRAALMVRLSQNNSRTHAL